MDLLTVLGFVVGVAVGAAGLYLYFRRRGFPVPEERILEIERMRQEAQAEADRLIKEARVKGKEEAYAFRQEVEQEIKERQRELSAQERRLGQKEQQLEKKQELVDQREFEILKQAKELEKQEKALAAK